MHLSVKGVNLAKDFKAVSSIRHRLQRAMFGSCLAAQAKPRALATSQPASQLKRAEAEPERMFSE